MEWLFVMSRSYLTDPACVSSVPGFLKQGMRLPHLPAVKSPTRMKLWHDPFDKRRLRVSKPASKH